MGGGGAILSLTDKHTQTFLMGYYGGRCCFCMCTHTYLDKIQFNLTGSACHRHTHTHTHTHTHSYQHVCGEQVVLAGHVGLQLLRDLLDLLDLVQQVEHVLVLDALDPQLPQLVPLTVQQHLTGQQVLLHLRERAGVTSLTGEQVLLHLRERAGVTQLTGGPGSPSPAGEGRCYSAHRRAGSPSPAGGVTPGLSRR